MLSSEEHDGDSMTSEVWHFDPHHHQILHNMSSSHQGNSRMDPKALIPFSDSAIMGMGIVYGSTGIAIMVANGLAVWMLISRFMSLPIQLRVLLVNLSLADLTWALASITTAPVEVVAGRWLYPPITCPIVRAAQVSLQMVIVWTLVLIGIERSHAVTMPLHVKFSFVRNHLHWLLSGVWLGGALAGLPLLLTCHIAPVYPEREDTIVACTETWPTPWVSKLYTMILFAVMYLTPLSLIAYYYLKLAAILSEYKSPRTNVPLLQMSKRKSQVVRMCVWIVMVFIVCWLPIQIHDLAVWLCPEFWDFKTRAQVQWGIGRYIAAHYLVSLHSLINPIVYTISHIKTMRTRRAAVFVSSDSTRDRRTGSPSIVPMPALQREMSELPLNILANDLEAASMEAAHNKMAEIEMNECRKLPGSG